MARDLSSDAFGSSAKRAADLNKELANERRNKEQINELEKEKRSEIRKTNAEVEKGVREGKIRQETVANEPAQVRTTERGTQAIKDRTKATEAETRATRQLAAERIGLNKTAPAGFAQTGGGGGGGRVPPRGFGTLSGGPPPGGPPPGGGGPSEADRAYAESARRVTAVNAAEQRLMQTRLAADAGLRRHGALTTEFFQAAARGTVTIRELGFQTAATIGKFGGWLTAGAALFGAMSAVQQIGRGALDAASGVNDLQRVLQNVDATKLRGQFSGLAEHFNVPIKDAADAVYQMGKVFKDQDQAVSAAATALYAVKIGELDVGTATRYLTAIIQGANLSAADMASLFDQVNNAQNTFGVSIQGTLAGMAKATGSFRNLGGDVQRYLLPLIAASQKLTGQTGDVAGTAFQRIPNYLAQPKNQAVLKQYGINPAGNIDAILQRELNLAQSGKLKRDQLRDIAYATFGHFYGPRIGVPLLQNPERVAQYQRTLSPEASRGSAERELNTLLGSIQERIKKIGVELQRLGDKLVSTHLLDAFGGLIVALGSTLKMVNTLADGFNKLPDGVKKALSYGLELMIVMRLLRRFQVGEMFAGGRQNPTGVRGFFARAGGYGSPITLQRLGREGLAGQRAALEDEYARTSGQQQRAIFAQGRAEEDAKAAAKTAQGLTKGTEQYNAAMAQHQKFSDEAKGHEERVAGLARDRQRIESQYSQTLAVQEQTSKRSLGIFKRVNTAAVEQAKMAIPTTGQRPVVGQDKIGYIQGGKMVPFGPVVPGPQTQQLPAQTAQTVEHFGPVVKGMAEQTRQAETRATGLRSLAQRASTASSGLGAQMRGLDLVGTLANIMFAVGIGLSLGEMLKGFFEKMTGQLESEASVGAPKTKAELVPQLQSYQNKVLDAQKSSFLDFAYGATHIPGTGLPNPLLGALGPITGYFHQHAEQMAEEQRMTEARLRQALYQDMIAAYLEKGGVLPQNPQQAQQIAIQQANVKKASGWIRTNLGWLGDLGRDTKDAVDNAKIDVLGLLRGVQSNPQAQEALRKTLRRKYPGSYGNFEGTVDAGRINARPIEEHAGMVSNMLDDFSHVAARLGPKAYREKVAELKRTLQGVEFKDPRRYQEFGQRLNQLIEGAVLAAKGLNFDKRLKKIDDPDTLQNLLEAQQSLRDAGKPQGTIQRAIKIYQRQAQVLKNTHDPEQLKKLADARKTLMDILQEQVDAIGQKFDLRASRINSDVNPVAAQRVAVSKLRAQLAFEKAHHFDPKQIRDLQIQLNQAQIDLVNSIHQQALDLAHSQFDVARARAGDNSVKTARIDIQQALSDMRAARTPEEHNAALAALITGRNNLRNELFNRQIEDIQFQADIGKLTLDQQMAAYRRLLKTETLTRDQRRELKRKIYELRQQAESDSGGFELDVGSIKLPTIYDIRRAIGGKSYQNRVNITNSPNVNITVQDPQYAQAVGQSIDNTLGTSTAAAMRSAGYA